MTLDERQYRELRRRFLTGGGNGVNVPVANAATTHDVTFGIPEPDVNYAVLVTPSWDTTAFVLPGDKMVTGFTVTFGAGAGATDTIDYSVVRA